jgi:alanine transaminase
MLRNALHIRNSHFRLSHLYLSSRYTSTAPKRSKYEKHAIRIANRLFTIFFFFVAKVLTTETMHPLVRQMEYAVRGALPMRAEALSKVSK